MDRRTKHTPQNRRKTGVFAQLNDILYRGDVDVALVQELYSSADGSLTGLRASMRQITAKNCRDPWAAVLT